MAVFISAAAFMCGVVLFFDTVPAASAFPVVVRGEVGEPGSCVLVHCPEVIAACMLDSQCRQTSLCNSKCLDQANSGSCNLICELRYGYNSTKYRSLLQCMSDHKCLPVSPPDGVCLGNDTDAIKNLTDMSQMKGKWWVVRGLNCGQHGWPGGFDHLPCQRSEFVNVSGRWIDRVAYCGGSNSTCQTPICPSTANVTLTHPGILFINYTDVPLLPQNEKWKILSWPHPDWIMLVYCGVTPNGPYAGGNVSTRSAMTATAIPAYVDREFRAVAQKVGFNYDTMCFTDSTNCSD